MTVSAFMREYFWCIFAGLTGIYLVVFNKYAAESSARSRRKYYGTMWGERDIHFARMVAVLVGIGSIVWAVSCAISHRGI